jgi:hypothetical protein
LRYEVFTNGMVGVSILIGVSYSYAAAIGQLYTTRALDMKEKGGICIIHPNDFMPFQRLQVAIYFSPRVVGHNFIAFNTCPYPLVFKCWKTAF